MNTTSGRPSGRSARNRNRYIEQLSAEEISAILGITLSSVYARHMRALERIRELVEQASQES